jgi:hypothetical protein
MSERWEELGGQRHEKVAVKAVKRVLIRHTCNHPDAHICPWIDLPDGKVARCNCPTEERS